MFAPGSRRTGATGFVIAVACAPLAAQVTPMHDQETVAALQDLQTAIEHRDFDAARQRFAEVLEHAQVFQPGLEHYQLSVLQLLASQRLESAASTADEAARKFPTDPRPQLLIVRIALEGGVEPERAERAIERAVELGFEDAESATLVWQFFQATQGYEGAVVAFRRLSEEHPDNAFFEMYLGQAQYQLRDFGRAAEHMEHAVLLAPDRWMASAHQALADAFEQAYGPGQAIDRYRAICERTNDPDARMLLSHLLNRAGRLEESVVLLQGLEREQDLHASSLSLFADSWDRTAQAVQKAGGEITVDGRAIRAETLFAASAQQYQRFVEVCRTQSPKDMLASMVDAGRTLRCSGQSQAAIDILLEAEREHRRTRDDEPVLISFQLAHAYYQLGNVTRAEELFREFHRFVRDVGQVDLETLQILADIYLANEEYPRAEETLRQALGQHPDEEHLRLELARALLEMREFDDCIAEARRVVESPVEGEGARVILSRAYLGRGEPELALSALSPVLGPGGAASSAVARALAEVELASGQHREALASVRRARELDVPERAGHDEELDLLEARALVLGGELGRARELFTGLQGSPSILRQAQGWLGAGEVARTGAEGGSQSERLALLEEARVCFQRAVALRPPDAGLVAQANYEGGKAEGDLAAGRAELAARAALRRDALILSLGLIVPSILVGVLLWKLGQLRAERSFRQLLELEGDLKRVIHEQVQLHWGGGWERLRGAPFAARLDYRALSQKAERESRSSGAESADVLSVADFGHLVAIVDEGWKELEFRQRAPDGSKRIVVQCLEYLSLCRRGMAHAQALVEEGRAAGVRTMGRMQLGSHMSSLVRTSIRVVRANLDFGPRAIAEGTPHATRDVTLTPPARTQDSAPTRRE